MQFIWRKQLHSVDVQQDSDLKLIFFLPLCFLKNKLQKPFLLSNNCAAVERRKFTKEHLHQTEGREGHHHVMLQLVVSLRTQQ